MKNFISRGSGAIPRRAYSARRMAIALFSSFFVLLPVLMSCSGHEEKKTGTGPVTVTVVTVKPTDLPANVEYVAQTQSSHQVNIQARVSGFLDKRAYVEGSKVKAGQVLFLMDKKPFQAKLSGATAALTRQKSALETARRNLERTRPLAAQHALSQKDLDDAIGSYESSAAAVEQAKSDVETARLNLSYCTISSPISGITGAAMQQDGTYISQQNSQLTTVAVLSPIWVNFSISENEMQRYRDRFARKLLIPPRSGKFEVEIILVDGSIFPHKGLITFASPSYNAQTGTFLLRASVDNPDGVLRPNQFVRALLKGAIRPGAIVLPQRAVQQGGKGHFVWVVDKGTRVEQRPVTAGEWYGNGWLISDGLKAGEKVVVDGGLSLQPGVPVKVIH
ncbi:MAG: efflux RND transporter periplasmic adaptor subunit [Geobacteraceae bacterium]|nr:efflux RND transporter periplasmic adaptor subunit [Geobacteraceae bacterium]